MAAGGCIASRALQQQHELNRLRASSGCASTSLARCVRLPPRRVSRWMPRKRWVGH
jgi:hypothetical protein